MKSKGDYDSASVRTNVPIDVFVREEEIRRKFSIGSKKAPYRTRGGFFESIYMRRDIPPFLLW